MISYEIAMGLSIIALILMTGTLSLNELSAQQAGGAGWSGITGILEILFINRSGSLSF